MRREENQKQVRLENKSGEFTGSPVVRNWCFQCQGSGLISGQRAEIPQGPVELKKKKKCEENISPTI